MSIFHILNGESLVGTFRETTFVGPYHALREDVTTGSIAGDFHSDEWLQYRANELIREFELEIEANECLSDLKRQEEQLERSLKADEVVLWFENDYFCQLNQVFLLAWYASRGCASDQISIFRLETDVPLGTLQSADFEALFPQRVSVSDEVMDLATSVWNVVTSSDPQRIVTLRKENTQALPIIDRTLKCHLSRFPSVKNGLGRIEQTLLEILSAGSMTFGNLFPRFAERHPEYGYGDGHVLISLRNLSRLRTPLIEINENENDMTLNAQLSIRPEAADVLAGNIDAIALNGIDQWIGGVHLTDQDACRWDEARQEIVR
jgi:hypothetical protein